MDVPPQTNSMKVTESRLKIDDATYGSDKNGLVWAFRFARGSAPRPIGSDEAAELLGALPSEDTDVFLWLHFSLSNAACTPWLRRHLTLPTAFLDSLQEGSGSTRVEQEGDSLVAIVNDVIFDSAFDASDVSRVSMCVQPRVMLSARLRPLRSIDLLRTAVKNGESFRSPAELLTHLLRDQADVLVQIVRHITDRVDEIEDNLLARRVSTSRAELSSLRRVLVRLQRLLAPEPAALFRLLSKPPGWIVDLDLQDLRQSAEEFSAAVADAASLVERVRLIQEELAALINEQNSRVLFLLTVVTVLALPFNVIAGLFGMNVGGIPFAQDGGGFLIIVTLVTGVTGIVALFALRRRRD